MKDKEEYNHILYEPDSAVPVICERKSWKLCPEHKHLSEDRPEVKKDKFFNEVTLEPFVDDPDDDIISLAEYGATSVAEDYIPPAHEEFKPAVWTPHASLEETEHDKQSGIGKVLKTIGAVAGLAGASLLLTACSASTVNSGTISDTEYHEAYTSISSVCTGTKPMVCHPVTTHHPEKWTITVDGTSTEGKTESRTLYVEEPVFNDAQIGETYQLTDQQIQDGQIQANIGNTVLSVSGIAVGAGLAIWGGVAVKNKIQDLRWQHKRDKGKPKWSKKYLSEVKEKIKEYESREDI